MQNFRRRRKEALCTRAIRAGSGRWGTRSTIAVTRSRLATGPSLIAGTCRWLAVLRREDRVAESEPESRGERGYDRQELRVLRRKPTRKEIDEQLEIEFV